MQRPTQALIDCLSPGNRVAILDNEGDKFEGLVKRVDVAGQPSDFVLLLEKCRKVGSSKILPGVQEFTSDTVKGIEINDEHVHSVATAPVLKPIIESKKKSLEMPVERKRYGNQNPHLQRLYPPQMDEILNQTQIVPPPVLDRLVQQEFQPRSLPIPCQEVAHMSGEKFKERSLEQFKVIRGQTWANPNQPPPLKHIPRKLYSVENHGQTFDFAVQELGRQQRLGLSVQGQRIGRSGQLSLLLMSTRESVFLFDVVSLGEEKCFGKNAPLQKLLEDETIMKVVHDCRSLSDMMYNKYKVMMSNVYDTLAAHTVFATWAIYHGFMPRYATPLPELVRGYLGIKVQFNHFPHKRAYATVEDTAIWMKRPLEPHMEMNAVYDIMYLLELQKATRDAMNRPFVNMTECLLSDVRDANDLDCSVKLSNVCQLPMGCKTILPNWKPNEFKASRMGMIEPPFVHQTMCQIDPMINFSRDVIHQKRPPGSSNLNNLNF